MKKQILFIIALVGCLLMLNQAYAAPVTYTFHPYDTSGQYWDINDLDHSKYYVWEVSRFNLAVDQHIVGAQLTFTNIYDWQNETNDKLYLHLLDSKPSWTLSTIKTKTGVDADLGPGTKTYTTALFQGTDNQGGSDNFIGMGTQITPTWSDPVGGLPSNNLIYDFAHLGGSVNSIGDIVPGSVNILSTLEDYLRNGNNFAFGIDPDCHYYNEKVTFTITTDTTLVPEPATMLLLGLGLIGLAGVRRRMRM
jgi:hypothetical protein